MIRHIYKVVVAWLILTVSVIAQAQALSAFAPPSQHDIAEINFTENTSTSLDTDWLFYQGQFITAPSPVVRPQVCQLPVSFKNLTGSNMGYGTFIGHFKIPKEFIGRRIAIHIPAQYGAYRVYMNGDFILRLGKVSTTAAGQVTKRAPQIGYFVPESQYFTLSIQVSNYSTLHGGLERPLRIGTASTINRQYQQIMMSISMVSGMVLGIGCFTILFSVFRGSKERNSRSIFTFGLFIVFLALHNLFNAPYAYSVFTSIDWLWGMRLQYLFTFLAILFFLSYMYLFNQRYLHRYVYYIAVAFLLFNCMVTLFTQPEIFERVALYSAIFCWVIGGNFIYGFYQTLRQKLPYSRLTLYAVVFLCLTFLNDYLLLINVIETTNLLFISTSLYALLTMFQQSRNYAHHTYQTEQLNIRLKELNSSLDQKVKERTRQLYELNTRLEDQMNIDALTGAFNRRALNEKIQKHFSHLHQDSQQSLIFSMLDVDYFKNYNDYYGHLKGDEILQSLVKVIQKELPESAYLARYGGEEFAILLKNVTIQVASAYLENVLRKVREQQFEHLNRGDHKTYVTVSIGVAWMDDQQRYTDIHELMKAADVQLYAAKQAGRDQLKMAE